MINFILPNKLQRHGNLTTKALD